MRLPLASLFAALAIHRVIAEGLKNSADSIISTLDVSSTFTPHAEVSSGSEDNQAAIHSQPDDQVELENNEDAGATSPVDLQTFISHEIEVEEQRLLNLFEASLIHMERKKVLIQDDNGEQHELSFDDDVKDFTGKMEEERDLAKAADRLFKATKSSGKHSYLDAHEKRMGKVLQSFAIGVGCILLTLALLFIGMSYCPDKNVSGALSKGRNYFKEDGNAAIAGAFLFFTILWAGINVAFLIVSHAKYSMSDLNAALLHNMGCAAFVVAVILLLKFTIPHHHAQLNQSPVSSRPTLYVCCLLMYVAILTALQLVSILRGSDHYTQSIFVQTQSTYLSLTDCAILKQLFSKSKTPSSTFILLHSTRHTPHLFGTLVTIIYFVATICLLLVLLKRFSLFRARNGYDSTLACRYTPLLFVQLSLLMVIIYLSLSLCCFVVRSALSIHSFVQLSQQPERLRGLFNGLNYSFAWDAFATIEVLGCLLMIAFIGIGWLVTRKQGVNASYKWKEILSLWTRLTKSVRRMGKKQKKSSKSKKGTEDKLI